jgi:hypothetical protein
MFRELLLLCLALFAVAEANLECDACRALLIAAENVINGELVFSFFFFFFFLSCPSLLTSIFKVTNITVFEEKLDAGCGDLFHNGSFAYRTCMELAKEITKGFSRLPVFVQSQRYPPKVMCAILLEDSCAIECCNSTNAPEQIYVTFGDQPNSMRASWITLNASQSMIRFGTVSTSLSQTNSGIIKTYTSGGWKGTVHHAMMYNLSASSRYYYQVGDGVNWSEIFSFKSPTAQYPRFVACIADVGAGKEGGETIPHIEELIDSNSVDWVLHDGDVSYADANQEVWDQYGRQRTFAAKAPYLLVPGNHEIPWNFSSYRTRYPMSISPGELGENLFWAFDDFRIRFIGLNSEGILDVPEISNVELSWLTQELATSAQRKRNGELDWIILSLHRPMYCSSGSKRECGDYAAYLRLEIEQLVQDNLVDLVFQAHRHNYERTTPVYQEQVMAASTAPVYVVNGIGGSRELDNGRFDPSKRPAWRVIGLTRNGTNAAELFGYGVLSISQTELNWEMYSDNSTVAIDQFTIKPRIMS